MTEAPFIVGIGGTADPGSSTEVAVRIALESAERACGARTRLFGGAELARLPLYLTPGSADVAGDFVAAVRAADGLILASPAYHGTISGLVKNAIDYLEETAKDARIYLDGLPVGLVVTAYGWQAAGSTLAALRAVVHALRGWPTPMGAAINTSSRPFEGGVCTDPAVTGQLCLVGAQVGAFANRRHQAA
jgi:FMN reductase